ncbi:hypothetical protein ACFS07_28165 [Undibacterium arcticum]
MRYLKWPVAITFLLYPAFALNLQKKGANVCFYLLVLFALVGLACRVKPLDKSFTLILREHWPVMLAMAGTAVAIFFCISCRTDNFRSSHMTCRRGWPCLH